MNFSPKLMPFDPKEAFKNDELKSIVGRHRAFSTFIKLLKKENATDDGINIPEEHQKSFSDQIGQLIGKDMPFLIGVVRELAKEGGVALEILQRIAESDGKDFPDIQQDALEYLNHIINDA